MRLTLTHRFGIILVLLLAGLWNLHAMNRWMSLQKSDLKPVQIGIKATLDGQNPYSDSTTRQIQVSYYGRAVRPDDHVNLMGYVYPIYTAVVLAPLDLLTFRQAQALFFVTIPLLTILCVLLWGRVIGTRLSRSDLGFAAGLLLASWPFLWAMRLQQVTLVLFVLLALGCYLLRSGHYVAAGVVLALATFKPQLALPLLAWLLMWATLQRLWTFVASLVTVTTLLLLVAEFLHPGWVPLWHQAGIDLLHYTGQRPILPSVFGPIPGGLMTAALIGMTSVSLWKLRSAAQGSADFGMAIGIILACTVALLPTDHPMIYNQVLLLPSCLVLVYLRTGSVLRTASWTLLGWTFASALAAAFLDTIHPTPAFTLLPSFNGLLPVILTATLCLDTLGKGVLVVDNATCYIN